MREIIIIDVNQSQQARKVLEKAHIDYRVYQEPKTSQKRDIFANYGEAIKDKEREKELKLWDNVDSEETLNNNGEW
jgi:hypothetical protein